MKKLLAALSLIVAAVVAWLSLWDGREPGPRSIERDGPAAPPSAAGLSDDAGDVGQPAPMRPVPETRRIAPVEDASAAEASASLLVVQAESGEPVAGADVAWVDLDELLPEEETALVRDHPLSDRARRARTDERGRVRIPRPRGDAWASASSGERSGVISIPAGSLDARLELYVDEWITVRVFSHEGKPATGVTVRLEESERVDRFEGSQLVETRSSGVWPQGIEPSCRSRGVTDERGVARLRDRRGEGLEAREARAAWVEADVAAAHPVHAWLSERAPPAPIELHLPPLGSIEVRLIRPDGTELTEESDVFLLLDSPVDGATGEGSLVTATGRVVFPRVEAGLELEVTAVPRDGVKPGIVSIAGPAAGGHVTAHVEVEGAFARLAGRLVDEAGSPLAHRRFEFLALPGSSGVRRSDALGRFSIGATGETTVLELARTMSEGERARIELGPLARGTRELGDVRLPERP